MAEHTRPGSSLHENQDACFYDFVWSKTREIHVTLRDKLQGEIMNTILRLRDQTIELEKREKEAKEKSERGEPTVPDRPRPIFPPPASVVPRKKEVQPRHLFGDSPPRTPGLPTTPGRRLEMSLLRSRDRTSLERTSRHNPLPFERRGDWSIN